MGEFDDALGRILGDSSAMAQIAKLAQSLGGGDSPPTVPAHGPSPMPNSPPHESSPVSDNPPHTPSSVGDSSPPSPSGDSPPHTAATVPGLSDWAGLADSPLIRRLLPLLLEGRQNSEARRFLYALRPYLSQRRQENVERALQLARLIRVGRRFLSEGRGGETI